MGERRYHRWPEKPLELRITLETADEMLQLRQKVAQLETAAEAAQAAHNHLEFLYRCECIVNAELVDQCRATGVRIRPALLKRRVDAEAPAGPG